MSSEELVPFEANHSQCTFYFSLSKIDRMLFLFLCNPGMDELKCWLVL